MKRYVSPVIEGKIFFKQWTDVTKRYLVKLRSEPERLECRQEIMNILYEKLSDQVFETQNITLLSS